MNSPEKLRISKVDAAASPSGSSDADEIIDLTDIVERGKVPAAAPSPAEGEAAESGQKEEHPSDMMADLRGDGSSDAEVENLSEHFDLDSLLDSMEAQKEEERLPSTPAQDSAESEKQKEQASGDMASDAEFDALLQDIVGDVKSPSEPSSDKDGDEEIALDDLDSLLSSLGDSGNSGQSDTTSSQDEKNAQNAEPEEKPAAADLLPEDAAPSDELNMDDLDGLLDSLGTPDVEAKAPADAHAAPAGDESFSSSASGDAPAPKKKAEAVVQAKEDAHPDDTAELADLDQLLDSILTEGEDSGAAAPAAPQKNETAADSPAGSVSSSATPPAGNADAVRETGSSVSSRPVDERGVAEIEVRLARLEGLLQDEQKKNAALNNLTARLDSMDSRLAELAQSVEKLGAEAKPDEEAIRAVVTRELEDEGVSSHVSDLTARLDAADSRLAELAQSVEKLGAEAKPDEEAIRAVVTRELEDEGVSSHVPDLTARLDAADSRLAELAQSVEELGAGAKPDEEAIRAVVTRELMDEEVIPPYVSELTSHFDTLESRLADLGQEVEKLNTGPDEQAIKAIVTRELLNEDVIPPYVSDLTMRFDNVDSRLEELGHGLDEVKAESRPDDEAIKTLVLRELKDENNTPPYVEGMVNDLVDFEKRIAALENRLAELEKSSEKAAAEAAARVIREEMSAMLAELGQGQ